MALLRNGIHSLFTHPKTDGMQASLKAADELLPLLQPETDLERALLQNPDFQNGLLWGKPRFGHPEGQVALHVREILDNVNELTLQSRQRERLRLIAFAHDTFKYREPRSYPRDWSQHHAVLARQFMESYTSDEVVLRIIEWHDEAFYIWRRFTLYKQAELAHEQLDTLLAELDGLLDLYYLFFLCDTQTGDKLQMPVRWFKQVLSEHGVEIP